MPEDTHDIIKIEAGESVVPEIPRPRWITEKPTDVYANKVLGGSNDLVLRGRVIFDDASNMEVAIKVAATRQGEREFRYRQVQKATTEGVTLARIRHSFEELFPGQRVPILYARTFNTDPNSPEVSFESLVDKETLKESITRSGKPMKGYEQICETGFPENQTIVVQEYLDPELHRPVAEAIAKNPKEAEAIFDSALEQYFELLVALHRAGISHNDRKMETDLRVTPDGELTVLDWDVPKPLDEITRQEDLKLGLDFFAGKSSRHKVPGHWDAETSDSSADYFKLKKLSPSARAVILKKMQVLGQLRAVIGLNRTLIERIGPLTGRSSDTENWVGGNRIIFLKSKGNVSDDDALKLVRKIIKGETAEVIKHDLPGLVKTETTQIDSYNEAVEIGMVGEKDLLASVRMEATQDAGKEALFDAGRWNVSLKEAYKAIEEKDGYKVLTNLATLSAYLSSLHLEDDQDLTRLTNLALKAYEKTGAGLGKNRYEDKLKELNISPEKVIEVFNDAILMAARPDLMTRKNIQRLKENLETWVTKLPDFAEAVEPYLQALPTIDIYPITTPSL